METSSSSSSTTPSQTLLHAYADAHLSSTATEPILSDTFTQPPPPATPSRRQQPYQPPTNPFLTTAPCTLYAFPSLEPTRTVSYPSTHLLLPLRRDILHRAVIYEGDATRQGTASTKWRSEVHGSNRKIRPQKGSGHARLGNKKSPMLKGGGVAFGPKPRDFSTELPRKMYDLAWRTALSYRYRKGELIVVDGAVEIDRTGPGSGRWLRDMLNWHGWSKADGSSLFVTLRERSNLWQALAMDGVTTEARALVVDDVDVKNLLEMKRLVVEKAALDKILQNHEYDLTSKPALVA